MKLIQTDHGWEVKLDETTAVEFTDLNSAERFMDLVDKGMIPPKALEVVLRRRARNEKRDNEQR